ncbi:MAG: 23S rRNA (guanosine(2251)-2'-O)-methyltransferase RlmB [Bacteroidota bacterium]
MNNNNRKNSGDLIFGTRAIIESINAGKNIDKLLLQKNLKNELIQELIDTAKAHHIPFSKVPIEKLNRITRKNHQGAICFLSPISFSSLDNVLDTAYQSASHPLLLILDRVTDVRNFGAITRTAECTGANAVIIPEKGSAAVNADAMKTSAGALNFIPLCRVSHLGKTLQYLKDSGLQIVACTEKAQSNLYDIDFNVPTAILMGSEEDGISPEYLKMADAKARIPMKGQISSLNVSVSTGVVLYEVLRQRSL